MSTASSVIFDYIFGLTGGDVKLELTRIEQFMDQLGKPYEAYPVIHIAGTNGKGSTASMLAASLRGYGYKVGLYTSPHLITPNERIRVNDQFVPDAFIVSQVESWRDRIDELGITFFEILTALALVYFKEQQVDYAVLETGLGGRLDATNVVDPLMSIITSISMDHENILGNTIELIAAEKAGIIKAGKPLVLARNTDLVRQIMTSTCDARNARIRYAPEQMPVTISGSHDGFERIRFASPDFEQEVQLPLRGMHQVENFQTVLTALELMDLELDATRIQQGLDNLQWWGRMQTLQEQPRVIYDVAHNPDGLLRLQQSLSAAAMGDAILIAAFNARKNVSKMLELLAGWPGPVLFTLFGGHSAVPRENLLAWGVPESSIDLTPDKAYTHALSLRSRPDQVICYFGSHYLAEDIYPLFAASMGEMPEKWPG